MPIKISDLTAAAHRFSQTAVLKSKYEAQTKNKQTAFLCHSHKDEDLAKGLQVLLAEEGWEVYIDWQDNAMPETPNKETALNIKNKIMETNLFLFLATPNSTDSKWCPWEIGFADAKKEHDKILIVPTTDQSGRWYGNEYLQLYSRIEVGNSKLAGTSYGVFQPGSDNGTWVRFYKG